MDIAKCLNKNKKRFGTVIENYLKKRNEISLIVFLIDIRHNPTDNDKLMYNYIISTGIPCLIIANKCDKIAPTKINSYVHNLQEILNPLNDIIFLPFSSEKKIYSDEVWNKLQEYIY